MVAAAIAMPASANADSIAITPPPEGVIGGKSTIRVSVVSDGSVPNLTVIRRRVDQGVPCQPSSYEDYSAARDAGASWEEVGSDRNATTRDYDFPVEWTDAGIKPGEFMFCAWLYGPTDRPEGNTTARATAQMPVRVPRASITIDKLARLPTSVGDGELYSGYRVHASGDREAFATPTGIWKRGTTCPARPRGGQPVGFPRPRKDEGPFEVRGVTGGAEMVLGRRYVICLYVTSVYVDGPLATARKVVEPKSRPLAEAAPGVYADAFPVQQLKCSQGLWAAYPRRIRYSTRWYRDGRRLRARGPTLRVRRRDDGHRYRCEVTARNAVGATTKRSRSYTLDSA